MSATPLPESWIKVRPEGLYVEPGGFYVDPGRAVERAVISHGHSDHARPGHRHVLATSGTLAIMRARLGGAAGGHRQALAYGQRLRVGAVDVTLVPAGHVLGSAQIVLDHAGCRVVVSGDYKRRFDRTCAPFEVVACDLFITEATFGLPVFRHPPDHEEIARLLHSLALFPERSHVVGVYALGKAQRLITLLRAAGYDLPIHVHGALLALCELYRGQGVALGELVSAAGPNGAGSVGEPGSDLRGRIVLAPPSAIADRWAHRLGDPVVAFASGWMGVRQRARQSGAELPLVISDHADWDELCRTITEVQAPEVWVTHGWEGALIHAARAKGIRARALTLIGREEVA